MSLMASSIQNIGFVSLGCPKNLVDSEQMLATLMEAGYDIDACTIVMSETELSPGALINCRITDSDGYDMIARPIEELEQVISLPLR